MHVSEKTSSEPISGPLVTPATLAKLASSHGYAVEAIDGEVGQVETPLFPPTGTEPDFLVIRLTLDDARFAVVPVRLISSVDAADRRIRLDVSRSTVATMPGDITLEY